MGQVVNNLLFGIILLTHIVKHGSVEKQNFEENLKCAIKSQTKMRKAVEEK